LKVAQAHREGLEGLHVFMCDGVVHYKFLPLDHF
jgi:hypothetical protein